MPSPLREQIARAIWEGVWQSFSDDDAVGSWAGSRNEGGAWAYRVADAVLPLVEAAEAAERLRLHTQLRSPEALERAITAWGALENMTPTDRGWVDYHADIGELMRAAVEALLGVAATPQPEEHDA